MAMHFKKWYLIFLLLFGYINAHAQVISGRVVPDSSGKAIPATIVTSSGHQASSNANGEFRIPVSGIGDTVKVFAIGYKTFLFPVKNPLPDNIVVRLKQVSIMLREVAIRAGRNHKKDSISLRTDYARVFNYHASKVTDAFTPPPPNVPFAFVNLDLGILFSAITRKGDPTNKLQKELLRDEQADYIRTRYNRTLVTRVTHLQGDSLDTFMDKYYPTAGWIKKTSDYDIVQYIKAKALEFRLTH